MQTYLKNKYSTALAYTRQHLFSFFNSPSIIILVASTLIILEIIAPAAYTHFFSTTFDFKKTQCLVFYLIYTFICFFVLPSFFATVILKDKLYNLGFRWPEDTLKARLLFITAFPACIACAVWLATQPSFQIFYGFSLRVPFTQFIIMQLISLPLYYLIEEFFFRGLLFLLLWKRIGWHAFWITELLFTLAHLGNPGLEVLFTIPIGIFLNLLTLWTRSVLPAIIFHSTIGMLLNFIVYFDLVVT